MTALLNVETTKSMLCYMRLDMSNLLRTNPTSINIPLKREHSLTR